MFGKGQVWKFGVYAINPTDASVHLVVRFPHGMTRRIGVALPSCIMLGSRVYITMYNKMWSCEIGGGGGGGVAGEWEKSRKFNGRCMWNPYLFTLKGYLFALKVDVLRRSKFCHNFQVKYKRGWVSLPDPPTLCTNDVEYHTVSYGSVLAISCIGDTKVIFHLSTTHFVTCYRDNPYFDKHHFLCYTLEHDFVGEWTRINLDCIDSVFQTNSAYLPGGLSCRSHLLGDDILLLIIPGVKLGAFGFSGPHLIRLDPYLLDLNDKLPHDINNLLLVQVSQRRYLAITFSKSTNLYLITFELIYDAPFLRTEIISVAAGFSSGIELPLPLGVAYYSA